MKFSHLPDVDILLGKETSLDAFLSCFHCLASSSARQQAALNVKGRSFQKLFSLLLKAFKEGAVSKFIGS